MEEVTSWKRNQIMLGVFFTSATVAVVVRTAMDWCQEDYSFANLLPIAVIGGLLGAFFYLLTRYITICCPNHLHKKGIRVKAGGSRMEDRERSLYTRKNDQAAAAPLFSSGAPFLSASAMDVHVPLAAAVQGTITKKKILVAKERLAGIIGENGEAIKILESTSGATIKLMYAHPNSLNQMVKISGTPEDIDSAEVLINQTPFPSASAMDVHVPLAAAVQGTITKKKILVAKERLAGIIGENGEAIKILESTSGATIKLMYAHPSSLSQMVTITGTPEDIANAEVLINQALED